MSRRFLKSILGSVLAVSLANCAMGQFNQFGNSGGGQQVGGLGNTGGIGQQSFGGLGQTGGFGQTAFGQTGGSFGQTGGFGGQSGFGQTGQGGFGNAGSNPFGSQGFGGATGLGQNPFGSLAGSAVLGATMGNRTGGIGGIGGLGGGLGGLGGGFGGLGGRNAAGGRGGRNGFNMNQNQQNQDGKKQVRATVKLGFSAPSATSSARSADINGRINRMASATVRGVNVQMEGRTAVITGKVPTLEDGKMMERLLSLEPGIDQVKNELTYESGETNSSEGNSTVGSPTQQVNLSSQASQSTNLNGATRSAAPLNFGPSVSGASANAGTAVGQPAQPIAPEVVPAPAR